MLPISSCRTQVETIKASAPGPEKSGSQKRLWELRWEGQVTLNQAHKIFVHSLCPHILNNNRTFGTPRKNIQRVLAFPSFGNDGFICMYSRRTGEAFEERSWAPSTSSGVYMPLLSHLTSLRLPHVHASAADISSLWNSLTSLTGTFDSLEASDLVSFPLRIIPWASHTHTWALRCPFWVFLCYFNVLSYSVAFLCPSSALKLPEIDIKNISSAHLYLSCVLLVELNERIYFFDFFTGENKKLSTSVVSIF